MSIGKFDKDPDAELDYSINWAPWLKGDTIVASSWVVPAGLTKTDEYFEDTRTTVWLSGGILDERYEIVNRITTTAGRIDDRTFTLRIKEK